MSVLPLRLVRRGSLTLGPAFVAAIAYVDPGNIAANTSAGARFGYALLWVVVLASAVAAPMQYLSAKLGGATGRSLPELMRERLGARARLAYWAQAEIVAVATDLAEVIGAAVALHLLFGLPMLPAALAAGALGLLILLCRDRLGARALEALAAGSLVLIGAAFLLGTAIAPPAMADAAAGFIPTLGSGQQVMVAAAIVGATIMPHAIYLHSGLSAECPQPTAELKRQVGRAMVLAGTVNVAMLLFGAGALQGQTDDDFAAVAGAITARLGQGATTAFLVALLLSGLTSTAVGTAAGETIMAGLLHRRISPYLRRILTLLPALVLIALHIPPVTGLLASQMVLSLGILAALVPLVRLTCDRQLMGERVNDRVMRVCAWAIVAAIGVLNVALVLVTLTGL
ncbi:manganese transport protein [Branchiibius hedensis]|uniref:Manganese transport protein n=1 Tax=Branchiibius hedensis TaxID=672460 RepID=A0A2Y8ZPF0_9MICO|nr:Nramp family divalent metal transporter [Branchiibius hedensis]PWJ24429.1 manganese transport protein [Branchiibius hedensis]SSA33246.1 manganese transport protein [Branchiibius hedensis]